MDEALVMAPFAEVRGYRESNLGPRQPLSRSLNDRDQYPSHHAWFIRSRTPRPGPGRIGGNERSDGGRPRSRSAASAPQQNADSWSNAIACSIDDRPSDTPLPPRSAG
jgi:hypothetical protein